MDKCSVWAILSLFCSTLRCKLRRWYKHDVTMSKGWKSNVTMLKTRWWNRDVAVVRWWKHDVLFHYRAFSSSNHRSFIIVHSWFYHFAIAVSPSFVHHRAQDNMMTKTLWYNCETTMLKAQWYDDENPILHCVCTIVQSHHLGFKIVPSRFHHTAIVFTLLCHRTIAFCTIVPPCIVVSRKIKKSNLSKLNTAPRRSTRQVYENKRSLYY